MNYCKDCKYYPLRSLHMINVHCQHPRSLERDVKHEDPVAGPIYKPRMQLREFRKNVCMGNLYKERLFVRIKNEILRRL